MAKHTATTIVVTCGDDRMVEIHHQVIKSIGDCFHASFAGSAKFVVDPESRAIALQQIAIYRRLAEIKELIFVQHEDCGGVGGKGAFDNDDDEVEFHRDLVKKATEIVHAQFTDITVKGKYSYLNGKTVDLDF